MSERKLIVIEKSVQLMEYTYQITSNKKRYPPKYRTLIEKIQNKSADIYDYLMNANLPNMYIPKEERLKSLTMVISSCDRLSCFVELSLKFNLISGETVDCWQGKINDIKYITLALRNNLKNK